MAHVKLNPAVMNILGQVGNLVFKMRYGSMYISRKPAAGRHFTEAQRAMQERFRKATSYGKAILTDPQARAPYDAAAKAKGKPVLSLMVADFLNPPEIEAINLGDYDGQPARTIYIRATDDFEVTRVDVLITSESGERIEGGPATRESTNPGWWVYVTTTSLSGGTPVRVEAFATDRPGNRATRVEACCV